MTNSEEKNLHEGHRERILGKVKKGGLSVLEQHEILEVLLFPLLPRVNTNNIAIKLIKRFGSLSGVFKASIDDLMEIKGIGPKAALYLNLFGQLLDVLDDESSKVQNTVIKSPEDAANYCRKQNYHDANEHLVALLLDKKKVLVGTYQSPVNEPNLASFDLKSLIVKASECKCAYVVLAHNHNDFNVAPSNSDSITTRHICLFLSHTGIRVLDHIIYDSESVFSFKDSHMLSDVFG